MCGAPCTPPFPSSLVLCRHVEVGCTGRTYLQEMLPHSEKSTYAGIPEPDFNPLVRGESNSVQPAACGAHVAQGGLECGPNRSVNSQNTVNTCAGHRSPSVFVCRMCCPGRLSFPQRGPGQPRGWTPVRESISYWCHVALCKGVEHVNAHTWAVWKAPSHRRLAFSCRVAGSFPDGSHTGECPNGLVPGCTYVTPFPPAFSLLSIVDSCAARALGRELRRRGCAGVCADRTLPGVPETAGSPRSNETLHTTALAVLPYTL